MSHEEPTREMFEQPAWDERYSGRDPVWSGRVNAQLAAEAPRLSPGRALDVGCGEGGDVIWLAQQGWEVTGADFSAVALERARGFAEQAGVADRTSWLQADLRTWTPDGAVWDLVTSQFLHLLDGGMVDAVRRMADAVAPGGTLLVVGHHPSDLDTGLRWSLPDVMFTPEQLLPAVDRPGWSVRTEVRERQEHHRHHEGEGDDGPVIVHDSVLLAVRS
jgi:SAM-dependent methyltransferase